VKEYWHEAIYEVHAMPLQRSEKMDILLHSYSQLNGDKVAIFPVPGG